MIFDRYIGFLDEFSIDVEVFSASGIDVGKGTLSIRNKGMPKVSFNFQDDVSSFIKHKNFICKSDEFTYQLIDCEVLRNEILPTFLIRGGEKRSKFKKINLLFQGLSQWMGTNPDIQITETEIIKKRETKVFNAEIDLHGNKFSIANEHWCETKKLNDNNNQINEYTLLTIEAKNFSWTASELITVINQIRTFFSLLLGHSIGLEYLLDASKKNKKQSIYFPNVTNSTDNNIELHKCFVNSNYLFELNKWQELLQVYFCIENKKYRDLWSRISGMFSYEGFWEHQVLAYVSLVDRYVSIRADDKVQSLPKNQFKTLRRKARKILEDVKLSHTEENHDSKQLFDEVIDSMCKQINENIRNTSIATFDEKLQLSIENSQEVVEILDLSEGDFKHLKKIRNHVAHGDNPPVKNGVDITYESVITNKLALLLRYWVFKDIGFSLSDFLVHLNNGLYPMTLQARINKLALDKASGNYFFLELNKTNFNKAKKHKLGYLVLNHIKTSNTFRVDVSTTNKIKNWFFDRNKERRSVEEELVAIVDRSKVYNVAYLNKAYLKYGDEFFDMHMGACILNCPEYIASNEYVKKRLRVFDGVKNAWLPSKLENEG